MSAALEPGTLVAAYPGTGPRPGTVVWSSPGIDSYECGRVRARQVVLVVGNLGIAGELVLAIAPDGMVGWMHLGTFEALA